MSYRLGSGLILLVGFTLFTGVSQLVDATVRGPTDRHQETLRDWDEERLAEVRQLLPSRGVVGFVEKPGPGYPNVMFFYMAQYVIAPLVIDHIDPNQDWVIGVFPEGSEPPPAPSRRHEVLLEDRSRGIICWKAK